MACFDELCTLQLTYIAICFTDFVSDPYMKSSKFGPSYIGIVGILIFVHMVILLLITIGSIKLGCKRFYSRKNKQRMVVSKEEKEQEEYQEEAEVGKMHDALV